MKSACLFLVLALLFEVAALDGFAWLCQAAYGSEGRTVDERFEGPLTQAGLVLGGPLALLAITAAMFLFWRRARLRVSVPCVVLACLPSLLLAVLFTHVLGCVRNWW